LLARAVARNRYFRLENSFIRFKTSFSEMLAAARTLDFELTSPSLIDDYSENVNVGFTDLYKVEILMCIHLLDQIH